MVAGAGTAQAEAGATAPPRAGLCPYYHEAIELIGKRWTGAIVLSLMPGPMRFSELAHCVPQISDRLLSSRLKELEEHGIVTRSVMGGAPVRVQYELTPMGRALEPSLVQLRRWACDHLKPARS